MKGINKSARTINVLINVIANYASQVVRIILEFITRTLFIKILGAELLGVSGLFSNILLVLSLSELGLSTVVAYSYYEPLAQDNYDKLTALTRFYKRIYNWIAVFVMFFGILLVPMVHMLIVSENDIPYLDAIYLLYVINTAASYLFAYKTIIFNADQKNYVLKKWDSVFLFVQSLLQIVVLILGKNYLFFLIVAVITTFVKNLICAAEANKQYPFLKEKKELQTEEKKQIIRNIKAGFIYKVSGVMLNGTDNIIISKLVGTIWVGYLSNYNMILTTISTFVVMTFNAFTAGVGNLAVKENEDKKYEIFNAMFLIASWIVRICVPCIFLLADEFIFLWLGEEFIIDRWSMLFKCCMAFFTFTLNPIYTFREAMGVYLKLKYVMLTAAVLNIIFSVILGLVWGMPGVLAASIIAMLLTYVWYEPKLLYGVYFKKNCMEYFYKQFVNIVMIVGVIILSKTIFGVFFHEVTWGNWIVKGLIIGTISLLCCVILDRRKEESKMIVSRLRNSIHMFKDTR